MGMITPQSPSGYALEQPPGKAAVDVLLQVANDPKATVQQRLVAACKVIDFVMHCSK